MAGTEYEHLARAGRPAAADWAEPYILQAFLYKNRDFEVIAALKYIAKVRPDLLQAIHESEPPGGGSFWIRRRDPA